MPEKIFYFEFVHDNNWRSGPYMWSSNSNLNSFIIFKCEIYLIDELLSSSDFYKPRSKWYTHTHHPFFSCIHYYSSIVNICLDAKVSK